MQHKGIRTIETESLILRQICLNDAEAMIKNWVSDKEVTRYLCWNAYSEIEKAEQFILFCTEENKKPESYKWCIEYKTIHEVVGTIDVVRFSNRSEFAEIGYALSRKFWNKGLMTEALRAVINYLIFEVGFNRVSASHIVDNVASGKVMQKCGMRFEGIERQGIKNNAGNFCDLATYAIVKSDLQ